MGMGVEAGVVQPYSQENLQSPELEEAEKRSVVTAPEGAQPCCHYDFGLLPSGAVRN